MPSTLSTSQSSSSVSTASSSSMASSVQASPEREIAGLRASARESSPPQQTTEELQKTAASNTPNGFFSDHHSNLEPAQTASEESPNEALHLEEKPKIEKKPLTASDEDKVPETYHHQSLELEREETVRPVYKDFLGLYPLSFSNRSKDLTERKLRQDFDSSSCVVSRIRGLSGLSKSEIGTGEIVIVSFADKESASVASKDAGLLSRYPGLGPAPTTSLVADRDGAFSIEFINSGMSGMREITNEFSKHGEVVKVMASGAKKADSSNTSLVVSVTPDGSPPMMPAIARGPA